MSKQIYFTDDELAELFKAIDVHIDNMDWISDEKADLLNDLTAKLLTYARARDNFKVIAAPVLNVIGGLND